MIAIHVASSLLHQKNSNPTVLLSALAIGCFGKKVHPYRPILMVGH